MSVQVQLNLFIFSNQSRHYNRRSTYNEIYDTFKAQGNTFSSDRIKKKKLWEQSLNAPHLSNNSCRCAVRTNENSSYKQPSLLETIEKALAFPTQSLFLDTPYDGMHFFSSLPLACAPRVSLPSTCRASTSTPFWQASSLTTSQLCHAQAASTRQFIYWKDMGNSLRSVVVSTPLGVSSCGRGPDANFVSHPCCCSMGGHRWEHGGCCVCSVGLHAWLSCLLLSRLP